MGAVDAIDQALEPYNCARKSYTWLKKLGFHMIDKMVLNANVFYISHFFIIFLQKFPQACGQYRRMFQKKAE